MNVQIELYVQDDNIKYTKQALQEIAYNTVTTSKRLPKNLNSTITVSVAFVNEEEIRKVNKKTRNKDVVTDVISIGDYSDDMDIRLCQKDEIFLGEVILCYNYIEQFAHENNCDIDKEFFTIYAHGILHLLGFSHSPEMFDIQDNVVANYIKK